MRTRWVRTRLGAKHASTKNYAALRGFHKTLTPLKIIGKKILSVAQMKFVNVLLTDGGECYIHAATFLLLLQVQVLFMDKQAQIKLYTCTCTCNERREVAD